MPTRLRLATALALLPVASCHPVPTAPAIDVRDGWARATAPGQTGGAAYVTIVNSGSEGDRLISVTTPRASMAMLHNSSEQGSVMSMRAIADVPVPGTSTVALAPLGTHIMLTGLSAPLKVGERLPLTLRFARAGERQVDAAVLPAGSDGPAH